jgi:predicted nuclease of predicted toxin-antitoxin system
VTRLLLDEMYPPALAADLRDRGIDCLAVLEPRAGLAGTPDDRVLAWAAAEGRAVVTQNVADFARLSATASHRGIVLVPASRYPRSRSGLRRLGDELSSPGALDGLLDGGGVWLP